MLHQHSSVLRSDTRVTHVGHDDPDWYALASSGHWLELGGHLEAPAPDPADKQNATSIERIMVLDRQSALLGPNHCPSLALQRWFCSSDAARLLSFGAL